MAKRTILFCVPLLLLVLALPLRALVEAENAQPDQFLIEFVEMTKPLEIDDSESALQKLIKQRFNVAVAEFQERYEGHQSGASTPRELLDAAIRLKDAEIALASTPAERTKVLERHLAGIKEFEVAFEALVNSGLRKLADLNQMRFERLTIAIELQSAKTGG